MVRINCSLVICLVTMLSISSCSKDGAEENRKDAIYPTALKGTIYYDWATEGTLKISLPDGTGGSFLPNESKLNNFDISRDGKWKLTVVNASSVGQYDIRFTISDIHTGAVAEEFTYNGPGLSASCKGYLSPDNSLILVTSYEKEDGITVLKRNGEFVARIVNINGEPIDLHVSALWLPNNHFLMTHGDYIVRVAPPYNSGTLVKEMKFQDWGELAVNQTGTQLALRIANHVHTMDIDGSNLKQVTTSNFTESEPAFSPDGKYLLVGSYYRHSGEGFGRLWQLNIIPNDGQQYTTNPDAQNSPGVIPVIWKGKDKIETGSGQMIWR
ncbi:MAG: TolB family protein [Arcticibacter sp.]